MAGKGKCKTSPTRIEIEAKQARVLEMRKGGATFPEIAEAEGYASSSGAYEACKAAMERTLREPADELRELELTRLDTMQAVAWERMLDGDLDAMAMALRISERRSRLLGLERKETPIKVKLPRLEKAQDAVAVVAALIEKVAAGEILPGEAVQIANLLGTFAKTIDTAELAEKLVQFEEMALAGNKKENAK